VISSSPVLRAEVLFSAFSGVNTIEILEIFEKYMTFSGKN
jgi:hypothetical protein